jgi:hypothetical protein
MAHDFTDILKKIDAVDTLAKTDWKGDEGLYIKLLLVKPLCESRLNNVYADLMLQNDITQLNAQLNALENYLQNYKAGQENQSGNIINTINAIVPIIAKVPFAGKDETETILTKIIESFAQKNADVVEKITKEKEDLADEVADLKMRLVTLSDEIQKKNMEVVSLTTEFQKQFSDAQEKRSDAFATAQKEREGKFEGKETERDNTFKKQTQTLSTHANTTLDTIEDIKKKIEDIYGAIGKTSIAGAQKIYANNAKNMAHWLQVGSLLFMSGAISVLIYLFWGNLDTITWSMFLFRFSIGGVLLLPAFYLANEARKQRVKENHYRELEIKMTAITPYFLEISDGASMDNVNLPEKDRVKLELAQKLLSPLEIKTDNNAVLPPDIMELIKTLKALVEAISKRA